MASSTSLEPTCRPGSARSLANQLEGLLGAYHRVSWPMSSNGRALPTASPARSAPLLTHGDLCHARRVDSPGVADRRQRPAVLPRPYESAERRSDGSNEPAIKWRKSALYEVRTRTYGLHSPRILFWSDSRKPRKLPIIRARTRESRKRIHALRLSRMVQKLIGRRLADVDKAARPRWSAVILGHRRPPRLPAPPRFSSSRASTSVASCSFCERVGKTRDSSCSNRSG